MNKTIDRKRLLFFLWIGAGYFFLGLFSSLHSYSANFLVYVLNNLWGVIYLIIINYLLFESSVPFVLRKRKYLLYNIIIGLGVLFIYMMLYSYGGYVWGKFGGVLGVYTPRKFTSLSRALENQMAYSVGSVCVFGISRHIYNYVQLRQATQQLRIEKQAAELSFLRSQTNPHFLFNTLNNIYSLARDKSDLAPESILRLSKMLRFMLYETGGSYIAIEQELKIITDYISLEKLRYDETLRINFNYDIEDMKQSIPPLLMMPLVENAFKHGVSETRHQPFVDIHLTVRNHHLSFEVKNSAEGAVEANEVKENIGLNNLRRQLELLYKDYSLSVRQETAVFMVTLKINLASHV
jgi:two-component system LytT family sensor kinase